MTEPTSLSTTSIVGLTALSLFFPGINEAILLGAFCGAVVFVMSSQEINTLPKLFHMLLALFCGLWGGNSVSSIISALLAKININVVTISPAIGALFCSAIAVHVLLYLSRNWSKLLPLPKGDT